MIALRIALVTLGVGLAFPGATAAQPSETPTRPAALPSIELPPELDRVLRDYERHWRAGAAGALAALFTPEGMIRSGGTWIRGRAAIEAAYANASGHLRLRAVDYAIEGRTGHIMGAYGYGEGELEDEGSFVLTLRKADDGRWLISADLDAG